LFVDAIISSHHDRWPLGSGLSAMQQITLADYADYSIVLIGDRDRTNAALG
jgi:hypothetical protein